ncbi:MAG TPA: M20/M25/M40 family metallo-hydrolase, partial [Polyangiaceae bacterium]|nr:M20/M25/M40 family metallo-hydrolase [Polyangiaceae bacterium]
MKAFASAAALAAATLVGTPLLEREPAPLPVHADPLVFSALRAQACREELLAGAAPHPVGSPGNDQVRARLVGLLQGRGYAVQTEEGWACSAYGTCARTRDVFATLPGTGGPADPVLVLSHYDGVGAGPAASDDGAGASAALEIARALRQGSALPRDVRFVFTDGEEAGLLGASAYAAAHGTAASAVVNLEARGTGGLALLFETGPKRAAVADVVSSVVARPKTSS